MVDHDGLAFRLLVGLVLFLLLLRIVGRVFLLEDFKQPADVAGGEGLLVPDLGAGDRDVPDVDVAGEDVLHREVHGEAAEAEDGVCAELLLVGAADDEVAHADLALQRVEGGVLERDGDAKDLRAEGVHGRLDDRPDARQDNPDDDDQHQQNDADDAECFDERLLHGCVSLFASLAEQTEKTKGRLRSGGGP